MSNPTLLNKKFPINHGEAESLLHDFSALLELLDPKQNHGYILDDVFEVPKLQVKITVEKILFFDEKKKITPK